MIYAKSGDRVTGGKCLAAALSLNPYFNLRDAKIAADTLKQIGTQPPTAVSAKPLAKASAT